jgi:predicted nuclease with TOPRIM domain
MVSNTSNKKVYVEKLLDRSNPALYCLHDGLIGVQDGLIDGQEMLKEELIYLNKQYNKARTEIDDLQALSDQYEEPLLAECLTSLKKKRSDMLTKTVELQEQISQYDAALQTTLSVLLSINFDNQ